MQGWSSRINDVLITYSLAYKTIHTIPLVIFMNGFFAHLVNTKCQKCKPLEIYLKSAPVGLTKLSIGVASRPKNLKSLIFFIKF